eukprot:768472-Hanusia_phi.AAC.1
MPRKNDKSTIALCGLAIDADSEKVKSFLESKFPNMYESFDSPKFDQNDILRQRKLVFINCRSADDAVKLCTKLHGYQCKELGIKHFEYKLQAVSRRHIKSLEWKEQEHRVFEGTVVSKRKGESCTVTCGDVEVFVLKETYSGNWNELAKGYMLRVEAVKQSDGSWKALETQLLKVAATAPKKAEANDSEGTLRMFRLQKLLFAAARTVLQTLFKHVWQCRNARQWTEAEAKVLASKLKENKELYDRLTPDQRSLLETHPWDKWNFDIFYFLILENGLLSKKNQAYKSLMEIKQVRDSNISSETLSQPLSREYYSHLRQQIADELFSLCKSMVHNDKETCVNLIKGVANCKYDETEAKDFMNELRRIRSLQGGANTTKQEETKVEIEEPKVEIEMNNKSKFILLQRTVGKGAMGSVFEGRDPKNGNIVALKRCEGQSDKRGKIEAQNLEKIHSKNIVRFLGYGYHESSLYIAMDLVVGEDYESFLSKLESPLPWMEAARDLRQVMEGIKAVHSLGIIHRDLKPSNIMRKQNGDIVVVDFGTSKLIGDASASLTIAGSFVGTPLYASPEQHKRSSEITAACDVFSIGVIFVEALTKRLPFFVNGKPITAQDFSSDQVLYSRYILALMDNPPAPLDSIPSPIADFIITGCLQKTPDERIPNAGAMLERWDDIYSQALNESEKVLKPGSAQELWENKCKFEQTVSNDTMRQTLGGEFSFLSTAVLDALEQKLDKDGNGFVDYEEFVSFFKDEPVEEVLKKHAEQEVKEVKDKDPESVFYNKKLLMTVRYKSDSMWGGYKMGTIVLHKGKVIVKKAEGSTKAEFKVADMRAKKASSTAVEFSDDWRSTVCYFLKDADCSEFLTAVQKTKDWEKSEE